MARKDSLHKDVLSATVSSTIFPKKYNRGYRLKFWIKVKFILDNKSFHPDYIIFSLYVCALSYLIYLIPIIRSYATYNYSIGFLLMQFAISGCYSSFIRTIEVKRYALRYTNASYISRAWDTKIMHILILLNIISWCIRIKLKQADIIAYLWQYKLYAR